ncbi:MAG: hypothetical protein HUU35_18890 [Armatimonadetes bacterium]|nr:hypothetical protein [Armatimonadota bacterium]
MRTLPLDLPEPQEEALEAAWLGAYGELHQNVREAITALPGYFRTETTIAGITATDIHTLNTVLGATIEEQVVRVLNSMRPIWDPEEQHLDLHFVRQAQTNPDVLLRRIGSTAREDIVLGIELKGWYLLAKEGEPSLRFVVTRAACAPQDLVAVVPWALSNVISGTPIAYTPWIRSARYCADMRNHYWQVLRNCNQEIDRCITAPQNVAPYPAKSDRISDIPASDSGGNFGRLARTGVMGAYTTAMLETPLCGIPVRYWLAFFKAFRDNATADQIRGDLDRLARSVAAAAPEDPRRIAVEQIVEAVTLLLEGQQD